MFVIPDWTAVIGLLPIPIFLGIVGPLITFLILGIVVTVRQAPPEAEARRGSGARAHRRRRPTDLPARPAVLPSARAHLPDRHHPLRTRRRGSRGHLSDVRARPACGHRHLHQLRPGPQRQAAPGAGRPVVRSEARRRRGRLTARRNPGPARASTEATMAELSSILFPSASCSWRSRSRPRRACRDARQRPPGGTPRARVV